MAVVLHKWTDGHGLPSLSPACVQIEAYLRFAGIAFQVHICTSPSNSPSGVLPALEVDIDVAGGEAAASHAEYEAASSILAFLSSKLKSLDSWLNASQRADALAFTALLSSTLDVASALSMWNENQGFSEFRKAAYSDSLPIPLNWVVPWALRRDMLKKLGQVDAAKVYESSCAALDAIACKLRSSTGAFFFGDNPSTLDALLYGHLSFYCSSPLAAPTLRSKAQSRPEICTYVQHINHTFFDGRAAPLLNPEAQPASWSDPAQGKKKPKKPPPTESELEQWRRSQLWLLGVGAAMTSYVLLGGKYIKFVTDRSALGDEIDDDEEEEEDEEDN